MYDIISEHQKGTKLTWKVFIVIFKILMQPVVFKHHESWLWQNHILRKNEIVIEIALLANDPFL